MIRVLAIIANEAISGPGRQLAALAATLNRDGTPFLIAILHRRGNARPPFAAFLDRLGVPHILIEDRGPLDFGILNRIDSVIRDFRPTIVQTHAYKATAVAWALRRRGARLPWIGYFHGVTHENAKARFYHWLDHRMLVSADRVVVMSARQQADFDRLGAPVLRINNAVLPDLGSAGPDDSSAIRSAGRGLAHPVLGVVGRLSPEKGVDVFLDACAVLARTGQQFSALIAGDGPERGRLEARLRDRGLGDRVRLLGQVSSVRSLYSVIDVLVIPSRSEGLPNALLEGLGADLPAVATAVGAIPEVLADPRVGLVVPPGDPHALAAAIAPAWALRHSPDGRTARAAVAEAYSLERRVRLHIDLYEELTSRSRVA
jgi:glycosyltransferase involved in cell wall biosynthesis